MKNIFFTTLLLLSFQVIIAQNKREEHWEKIRALKTAHITEGLGLNAEEAQLFWPIYNTFQNKRRDLYRKERADIENLECLTEKQAFLKLQEYVDLEKQDFLLKKEYFKDLGQIFTAKRIMQLKQLEDDFNRKLMRQYHSRGENKKK